MRLRDEPEVAADLGTVVVLYGVQASQYRQVMADIVVLLERLRDTRKR